MIIRITSTGNCLLCNNNSHIANHTLRNIMRMIEARHDDVIQAWIQYLEKSDILLEDRIIVRGLPFAQKGVKGRPQYE